jgi:superfamily II DNA or RNA helicase
MAAFQNPEFYRAQAMRMSTHQIPRIIHSAEDHDGHLSLPRGCLEELLAWLGNHDVVPTIRDLRCQGTPLDVQFSGSLRPDQQVAGAALLAHDTGVLAAGTAFGKTVMAAWLIAQRGANTLVLVHRQQLLEQWVARLAQFFNIDPRDIGRLGGGKRKLTGRLDVALIQSLCRKDSVDDAVAGYGHVVVDECHHVPAVGFERVLRRVKARFVTGLSATLTRKDGHHPLVSMQCGPVRHRVDARLQARERPFEHEVWVRPTGFLAPGPPEDDRRAEFQRLCALLANNDTRDDRICSDVLESVRQGRSPIVLTERSAHLERLVGRLSRMVPHVITLQGGMGRRALLAALEQLKQVPAAEGRVLVATGRFIGEGFDDARLDTLFLAMPISWRGTIAQYVGRLHRLHEGKSSARVYDYVDLDVPMLARMFEKRCQGYEAQGYRILLPASALPGWPSEVPLPVDPAWKQRYSDSIRQLIHDGVDIPLAQAFLAATTMEEAADGSEHPARSASEQFLFRRLESLPDLSGKFAMNALLPIPFDDHGRMEVDFLCREARLVVEIDGSQHLANADAWRRDRRKDLALQQHGYLVLRFLAEDLGKHHGTVIETMRRVLAGRMEKRT